MKDDFWEELEKQIRQKSVEIRGLMKTGERRPNNYYWVMLDDVVELLNQLKQNYVVMEREKLHHLLSGIRELQFKQNVVLEISDMLKEKIEELLKP